MNVLTIVIRLIALTVIVAITAAACSSPGTQDPREPLLDAADAINPPSDTADQAATADSGDSSPLIVEPDWVKARLAAVQGIWGFTPAGVDWQNSYDLRQMRGQPAWFGSTGSAGWAGAGQAIPQSVLHELGHSYWGAFPVHGRDDLAPGSDIENVLESYRDDLLAFMRQPPDRFEPLRDRFRNLPNLDRGGLPDLAHFGESELIYFAGGDLDLVPPILRKYYVSYLTGTGVAGDGGDFGEWPEALAWWFALDDEERSEAGRVFGLQHFPLGPYLGIAHSEEADLSAAIVAILDVEERQRLTDFADQFDEIKERRSALTDAAGADRGFNFWARYLRDMFDLHYEHPEVLASHAGPRGRELGLTFDAYQELDPLPPVEQAERYRALTSTPAARDIRDFAPLLKARTLLELFPAGGASDFGGIEAAASAYTDELRDLVTIADAALATGKADPQAAATEMSERLAGFSDGELAGRIDTVFGTMRDAEPEIARVVIEKIPDTLLLRLLAVRPSAARAGEIPPERLLSAAGVTSGASPELLIEGIALLAGNSSGNFSIDAPSDDGVYEVLDGFAETDPNLVLRVFRETDLRLLPWVTAHAESAVAVLGADPVKSGELLFTFDGPEPTPERIVRQVAYLDAGTAVELMLVAVDTGRGDVLTRTLNTIVYDAYWSGLGVGPSGRLESAAALLIALRDRVGEDRTAALVGGGVFDYLSGVAEGELEAEYRARHIQTLKALESDASSSEDAGFFESLSAFVRDA
jgi:hypothetical protein